MSFKLQKIKNAVVKFKKGPGGRYDEVQTHWIEANGRKLIDRIGLWPLSLSDKKYVCNLWCENQCRTLTTDDLKEMRQQLANCAYIFICHDGSFEVKLLPDKLLQAALDAKFQDLPLYELLPGEIEFDVSCGHWVKDLAK